MPDDVIRPVISTMQARRAQSETHLKERKKEERIPFPGPSPNRNPNTAPPNVYRANAPTNIITPYATAIV